MRLKGYLLCLPDSRLRAYLTHPTSIIINHSSASVEGLSISDTSRKIIKSLKRVRANRHDACNFSSIGRSMCITGVNVIKSVRFGSKVKSHREAGKEEWAFMAKPPGYYIPLPLIPKVE